MFVMYDDTNLDNIPAEPHAVASYINGEFANHDEAQTRFPHARHLGISVTGMVAAQCYDVEKGDYSPDDVPELYKLAIEHGIWRPCFYAQLSGVMPAVRAKLNTVVSSRKDVRLWVAYYNEQHDLPPIYDAHQFTDTALGRSLDESICASDFFKPAAKPAPAPAPAPREREPQARVTYDPDEHTWKIEGIDAAVEAEKPGA